MKTYFKKVIVLTMVFVLLLSQNIGAATSYKYVVSDEGDLWSKTTIEKYTRSFSATMEIEDNTAGYNMYSGSIVAHVYIIKDSTGERETKSYINSVPSGGTASPYIGDTYSSYYSIMSIYGELTTNGKTITGGW